MYDDGGNPISGATIDYKQTSRDFLFGVGNIGYNPDAIKLLKEAGINHLEPYLSWNMTMNTGYISALNIPGYSKLGCVLTGANIVWMVGSYPGIPGADPWNLPSRVKRLRYDELKKELYEHVYQTVSAFKGFITYWTINELFWRYADPFNLTPEQWVEICRISVDAIKKADPQAKILINSLLGDVQWFSYHPIENLRLLKDKGIEFDVIGLEIYGGGRTPEIPLDNNNYPIVSWVSERLDRFSQFGKPIILTEVGVPRTPGFKKQIDWLRNLYTMAFAKPYVRGVVWIFATDDPFLPNTGLFLGNWWETPLIPHDTYYGLKNLTTSWLTEGSGTTDNAGKLSFRGFAGNYSITITAEGFKPLETTVHAQEQMKIKYDIHMQKVAELQTATTRNQSANATSKPEPTSLIPSLPMAGLSPIHVNIVIAGVLITCFATLLVTAMKKRGRPKA
jgi:hypothetical protein